MSNIPSRWSPTFRRCLTRPGLAAAVLLLTLAGVGPAAALSVGDKVSRQIELGDKQIPLPGGEWTLAGLGTQSFQMQALGAFGAIKTAVLFLTRQDRVVAVLEVNANMLQVNDGWGRTKGCAEDGKQFLLVQRYRTGWETSCLFVQAAFQWRRGWSGSLGAGPSIRDAS